MTKTIVIAKYAGEKKKKRLKTLVRKSLRQTVCKKVLTII